MRAVRLQRRQMEGRRGIPSKFQSIDANFAERGGKQKSFYLSMTVGVKEESRKPLLLKFCNAMYNDMYGHVAVQAVFERRAGQAPV